MDSSELFPTSDDEVVVIENWPINFELTREQLRKAQKRLERYRAVLRLASVEIKRRNRDIIALTAFTHQTTRIADAHTLLKLALVQALDTTDAPVGAVVIIDAGNKALTLGIHKGLTVELNDILTGRRLNAGAAALMPHLVAGNGALLEYHTATDRTERLLLAAGNLTSLVSLPLQIGPRLIGALLVGLQDKRSFTSAELCFLMAISQETATALESLRLREGLWRTAELLLGGQQEPAPLSGLQEIDDTELDIAVSTPLELPRVAATIPQPAQDDLEQLLAAMMDVEDEVQQQNADLQTLSVITEMMNRTLDLKEILRCAVEQTQEVLKTDMAWLYLVNEKKELEMKFARGLSDAYMRGMHRVKWGDGIEGRVVAQNRPHFIESISADGHKYKFWVDKEDLRSVAAVPITRPESGQTNGPNIHVIGVLAAARRTPHARPWAPREMRLLVSIANQVALAIDNAQLYYKLQEDEAGLRSGNEVLREINNMLLSENAALIGFIHDDLSPALAVSHRILKRLQTQNAATLSRSQQQDLAILQRIVTRLSQLAQETASS
jgi:GAF domain-containing protein